MDDWGQVKKITLWDDWGQVSHEVRLGDARPGGRHYGGHAAGANAGARPDPTLLGGWDGPHPGNVVPKVSFEGLKPPTHILITDVHGDHLDGDSVAALRTPMTDVVVPGTGGAGGQRIPRATQIANGQTGYIVTLGGKRLYLSGDTECTLEMKALRNIDVALIAMNLPFTTTPAEAAECAKALAGSGVEVRLLNWYKP